MSRNSTVINRRRAFVRGMPRLSGMPRFPPTNQY
jgi:hypothetical protein